MGGSTAPRPADGSQPRRLGQEGPPTRVTRDAGTTARSGKPRVQNISDWHTLTRFISKKLNRSAPSLNRKVVDLIPLYKFYIGCTVFCSTIFAQKACQDADFLGACE
jgi:hypothetical protein